MSAALRNAAPMLAGAVALLLPLAGAAAQASVAKSAVAPPSPIAMSLPSLASIEQAWRTQDYSMVELRRFRDPAGNVVSVRERIDVDASGSGTPKFALTFLGVEGELPNSPVTQKWQQTYNRFERLFFLHSSFHIKDLGRAASNYVLHDFGPITRANRAARRFVVWPSQMDKSIWVIDVDAQTSVPLYSAEFDIRMRLLSEVEGLTFSLATPSISAATNGAVPLADFTAAKTYLGDPNGLINPNVMLTSEYQIEGIEVRDDPLSGQQKLVMTYTDGIDEFMIVQTPNASDMFAGLPARTMSGPLGNTIGGNTIGRYRDPALTVLLFWDDGVAFQIAGRGSLQRLDELARRVYLQARSE